MTVSGVPSPSSSHQLGGLCVLFLLKGAPSHPALTHPTALADLNTLNFRADPGAQVPAIATQNWPWPWPTSRQTWSWGPWTGSLLC